MKRGTPRHPKLLALADALGIERWGAAGLLECLWHWAADFAPRGDLGRHTNIAIADGLGWEGSPDFLVAALLGSGWLDGCTCHRFRIHDWPDHVDNGIRQKDQIRKQGFVDCYGTPPLPVPVPVRGPASEPQTPGPMPGPTPGVCTPDPGPRPAVAVAVAVAGARAIPTKERIADAAAPALRPVPKGKRDPAWSTEAADDWIARYRGKPHGSLFKALEPLVKREGWERVRPVLRHYLADTQAEYVNVPKFASQFGEWEARSVGRAGPAPPSAKAVAHRQATEREIAASLVGDGSVPMGGRDDGRSVGGRVGNPAGLLPGPRDDRGGPSGPQPLLPPGPEPPER